MSPPRIREEHRPICFVFRKEKGPLVDVPLKPEQKKDGNGDYMKYVGQRAVVSVAIPAGGEGRVAYRGSEWIACSVDGWEIPAGTAIVVGIESIKFKVSLQG
jgi:membrane protein implicated in regulation of membrane protease activity